MSSSTEQSTHRALLNLERSTAPPSELLEEAARILGVNFGGIKDELFSESGESVAKNSIVFAAREEWTLRWLLKKTKPGARTTSSGSKLESSANHDPRKWFLFYHLVQKVPVKKVARIVREHEAIQQIQDALKHLVHSPKPFAPTTAVPRVQATIFPGSEDADYALPQGETNKRKRSPDLEGLVDTDSNTVPLILSVLRALEVCLENSSATDREGAVAQQHMRIALSLPPEIAGSILGYVLLVVNNLFENTTHSIGNSLLRHLMAALRTWDLRRGPDLGHTNDECNQIFTAQCLPSSMSLLESLRNMEFRDHHRDLETWLERHIVQHSIEPARQVFFNELAADWKADRDPISPEHIQPAVDRLQSLLFPSPTSEAQPDATTCHTSSSFSTTPILLELAVRSCPKSTVRKAQHEQPWLEALLVCLAHVDGCSLVDNERVVQARSLVCLKELLKTAIQWKVDRSTANSVM